MAYKRGYTNIFTSLYECDDGEDYTSNNVRKAKKKLRQIHKLEKIPEKELTSEQRDKIAEKQKWESELKPTAKTHNIHNSKDDIERKKRQHKKSKKREQLRKKIEEIRHQRKLQEERERKLREQRKRKL